MRIIFISIHIVFYKLQEEHAVRVILSGAKNLGEWRRVSLSQYLASIRLHPHHVFNPHPSPALDVYARFNGDDLACL